MVQSCGLACVKTLLFVFNFLFASLLDDFASVSATAKLFKLSALEKALSKKFMQLQQVNQKIMINAKLRRGELREVDRDLDKVPSNYGTLNALKSFPNVEVWHGNIKTRPCVLTGHDVAKNVIAVLAGRTPSECNAAAIWRSCLFYGPSGVGKTLAMRILYENCPQPWRCFWLDVEELRRCQDNLTELVFFSAACHCPAIIILDNIDKLCSTDRAVNDLARRLSWLRNQNCETVQSVNFLAACRQPWNLPQALNRELKLKIYFELPRASERLRILQSHLPLQPSPLSREELLLLANATEGNSGGQIAKALRSCKAALTFGSILEELQSKHPTIAEADYLAYLDSDIGAQF